MKKNESTSDHWGKRLSALLKEKKISLRKAAALAGVAPSVVDSWTGGATPGNLGAVKRLSDALGTSFTWLLTGSYERDQKPPSLDETFEEVPYFDGLARIRINCLLPRKKESDGTSGR